MPLSLSQIAQETEVAFKKRKLTEEANVEPAEIVKRPATPLEDQRQQLNSSEVPKASTSEISPEISVSSQHRKKESLKSPKTVLKTRLPTSELSNITTPFSTPNPLIQPASTTSHNQVQPNIKPTRTTKEVAPVLKKATTTENQPKTSSRLVKTIPASAMNRNRGKKKVEDKEAMMTPMEYAAILHEKWQAKVSHTPPEKLVLKDCTIFLVFEEKNKSTKDTRIKLDIVYLLSRVVSYVLTKHFVDCSKWRPGCY